MQQIETLIETGTQLRRRQPNRCPAHYQKVGSQLRILQQLRRGSECRHTHQDHRYHQTALQQPQDCAKETVNTTETGMLHHPAGQPGGEAEQEHDGKENDEETENLS